MCDPESPNLPVVVVEDEEELAFTVIAMKCCLLRANPPFDFSVDGVVLLGASGSLASRGGCRARSEIAEQWRNKLSRQKE
jgi:hypothetical protein